MLTIRSSEPFVFDLDFFQEVLRHKRDHLGEALGRRAATLDTLHAAAATTSFAVAAMATTLSAVEAA